MKKTVLAALLLSFLPYVYAADVAYEDNDAGGKITLTDNRCNTDKMVAFKWYTTDQNGGTLNSGCWALKDGWVVASDGDQIFTWNLSNFVLTDYGTAKYGK
jgi:hypothetical protein